MKHLTAMLNGKTLERAGALARKRRSACVPVLVGIAVLSLQGCLADVLVGGGAIADISMVWLLHRGAADDGHAHCSGVSAFFCYHAL